MTSEYWFQKLSMAMEKRYGCRLKYLDRWQLEQSHDLKDIVLRNPTAPVIITAGAYLYPMRIQNEFVGVTIVETDRPFEPSELGRISELVTEIFSQLLVDSQKQQSPGDLEAYLEEALSDVAANVIRLSDYRRDSDAVIPSNIPQRTHLAAPVLFGPMTSTAFHKKAFDLHCETGRIAFLYWKDINPTGIESATELAKLGDITLAVPDLSALTHQEMNLMQALFEIQNVDERPLVIGSSASMSGLPRGLLRHFSLSGHPDQRTEIH